MKKVKLFLCAFWGRMLTLHQKIKVKVARPDFSLSARLNASYYILLSLTNADMTELLGLKIKKSKFFFKQSRIKEEVEVNVVSECELDITEICPGGMLVYLNVNYCVNEDASTLQLNLLQLIDNIHQFYKHWGVKIPVHIIIDGWETLQGAECGLLDLAIKNGVSSSDIYIKFFADFQASAVLCLNHICKICVEEELNFKEKLRVFDFNDVLLQVLCKLNSIIKKLITLAPSSESIDWQYAFLSVDESTIKTRIINKITCAARCCFPPTAHKVNQKRQAQYLLKMTAASFLLLMLILYGSAYKTNQHMISIHQRINHNISELSQEKNGSPAQLALLKKVALLRN